MVDRATAADITRDLIDRLRYRYGDDGRSGTVILFEVGDGAGFSNRGWSDAIAMQTWPSKGLEIHGFEIKATRSDWLRELDKPEKNRTWQELVDAWYVVAPKDVVHLAELPPDWGLMVPKGSDQLRIASRAAAGTQKKWKDPIPRDLVAAVFRAAGNERRWARQSLRDELRAEEAERVAGELERLRKDAGQWERNYKDLAETIGNRWESIDRLKERVQAIRAIEAIEADAWVRQVRKRLESSVEILRKVEEGLRVDPDEELA